MGVRIMRALRTNQAILAVGCLFSFCGIFIEKGMGLITPGFVPSTLHEIVEYAPSANELKVVVGIWALGFMIYTLALKIGIPILAGRHKLRSPEPDGEPSC